jgi:4-carboxymuconolactone decarboxylase
LSPASDELFGEQRGLEARMRSGIKAQLQGFVSERADGALIGPFIPMLHLPELGRPYWNYVLELAENAVLPKPAHEVAILVAGAWFGSRYEIDAHEHVARSASRTSRGRKGQ